MITVLLYCVLAVNTDLTNSHAVKPLHVIIQEETPPAKVLPTWEVMTTSGKVYTQAVKMAMQDNLVLFADDEDDVVLAVKKENFIYGRKMGKQEKVP